MGGADGRLVFFTFDGEQVAQLNHGGILKYVEFNLKPGSQNMVVTCNDIFKSAAEGTIPNRIMIWQWHDGKQTNMKRLLSIDEALPMRCSKVNGDRMTRRLFPSSRKGSSLSGIPPVASNSILSQHIMHPSLA